MPPSMTPTAAAGYTLLPPSPPASAEHVEVAVASQHPPTEPPASDPVTIQTPTQPLPATETYLRFLKRFGLLQYAPWFCRPDIAWNTEEALKEGIDCLQAHPQLLDQMLEQFPSPQTDFSVLRNRLITQHTYALLIVSPDTNSERHAAILAEAQQIKNLFVNERVFAYSPQDVCVVVARTANDIRIPLKQIAIYTELNQATCFAFYYCGRTAGQALVCGDSSFISGEELSRGFDDIRAARKIVFLDSFVMDTRAMQSSPSPTPLEPSPISMGQAFQLSRLTRGMAILGSAKRNDVKDTAVSGFTSLLIGAFNGLTSCPFQASDSPAPCDQCSYFRAKCSHIEQDSICILDLFQFIQKHVQSRSSLLPPTQTVLPYLQYEGADNFRVCRFSGQRIRAEDLSKLRANSTASSTGSSSPKHRDSSQPDSDAVVKQRLEKAVERVLEAQLRSHAPQLLADVITNTTRAVSSFLRTKYARERSIRLLPWVPESTVRLDRLYTSVGLTRVEDVMRPPQQLDTPASMYAELSQVYQLRHDMPLNRIFGAATDRVRRLLVQGRPGIGKSTLCRRMVAEWAADSLWLGRFHALFLIRFDALTAADTHLSLPELLHKHCLDLAPVFNPTIIGQTLHQRGEKFLIILDGFERFTNPTICPALHKLTTGQLTDFQQCRVIVTSRASAVSKLRDLVTEQGYFDMELELIGFNSASAQRLIVNYFDAIELSHFAPAMTATVAQDALLRSLMHIPFVACIMCMIWEERQGSFPETQTELIRQIVEDIIERNVRMGHSLAIIESGVSRSVKTDTVQTLMLSLGRLAWDGTNDGSLLFHSAAVEQASTMPHTLIESGLLNEDRVASRRRGSRPVYYFLHPAFQEYLAAWFLVRTGSAARLYRPDPFLVPLWRYVSGLLGNRVDCILASVVGHENSKTGLVRALECVVESKMPLSASSARTLQSVLGESLDISGTQLNERHLAVVLSLADQVDLSELNASRLDLHSRGTSHGKGTFARALVGCHCITILKFACIHAGHVEAQTHLFAPACPTTDSTEKASCSSQAHSRPIRLWWSSGTTCFSRVLFSSLTSFLSFLGLLLQS
jgi:hypothetical protein